MVFKTLKVLFCVEFYFPSIGGAQEVVRRIAENFSGQGVEVHVATSALLDRNFSYLNGVSIHEFSIAGNIAMGIVGDVDKYTTFLLNNEFDAVFFYAAQQWTFDAAWPTLDFIKGKKYLVPCGYSGLLKDEYKEYFEQLPNILEKFNQIIYHSLNYQDVEFARKNKIFSEVLIPNGADTKEFSVPLDESIFNTLQIDPDSKVLLSVGSLDPNKGFSDLLKAIYLRRLTLNHLSVIINGNYPTLKRVSFPHVDSSSNKSNNSSSFISKTRNYLHVFLKYFGIQQYYLKLLKLLGFSVEIDDLNYWQKKLNQCGRNINVKIVNLKRSDLIQLYLHADLYVFASKIEYSPLVLFESCAAGLPFLSSNAGNADEICKWTGGGTLCNFMRDKSGTLSIDPEKLGAELETLLANKNRLITMSIRGRAAIEKKYNWEMILESYANLVFNGVGGKSNSS